MQLRLADKHHETEDVVTFVWEPEEPLQWKPGQFLKYTLPHENADDRGNTRWFTIAAPPYEGKPRITTRVTADHGSTFKAALERLQIGDSITASGPSGTFTIEDPTRPLVLVAGGIGVTPYRAILLQFEHDNVPINGHLLYANRNDQYVFKDELESAARKQPNFHITYFTGATRIELADLQAVAQALMQPLYYLSGPEPMVDYYKNMLLDAGFAENDIKTDYFPGYN